MTTPPPSIREYEVHAETTRTFGRVLASARTHHFIVDGPVQNGCPGVAITPPELLLSSIATCGAELVQVIARDEGVPLDTVAVSVRGTVDRSRQPRSDLTVLTRVDVDFVITGADDARAAVLVEGFKRR
jgi:uncharacterized OsmC-like protein